MFSVKKIIFSLLLLPFLFSLGSLIISKQAHAQITYSCANGIVIANPTNITKQQTQTRFTLRVTNRASTSCTYIPIVSKGDNVVGWNFSFNTTGSYGIPANSSKDLIVTAKPPSQWLNNPSNNGFRVRLNLANGTQVALKDVDYPASYAPNCKAAPTLTSGSPTNDGGSKVYPLTLKNNDGAGCNPTDFRILTTKPTNWTTAVQNSIGGALSSPVTKGPGGTVNFKVKVTPPSNAAPNTNPGYTIKTSVTGDSLSDSVSLIYPISAPSKETFKFTGYVFIDKNGDGIRQGTENCYAGNVNVRLSAGADSKQNNYQTFTTCNTYTISTTTSLDKVSLSIGVPSGYNATKLNYRFNHLGEVTTQTANGSLREFSNSNTVNFGIIPESGGGDTTATRDLVVTAFNFPGGVDTGTSDPTVTIKNQGNTQITGDFNVKVENKQNGTGTSQVWSVTQVVSPGESISHTYSNLPRPAAGDYTAKVTVDSGNAIAESNESNNTKTDAYTTTNPGSNPTNPPSETCDKNPPTLEITPNNRNGNPGDEREYDVKVINNDKGASCNPVNFVLSKEHLPNTNWTGSFVDNTLNNVEKNGGFKSTKFKVKSPSGATSGPKTLTLGVRRESQTTAQVQVNTLYTVNDNTPTPTTCTRNEPEFIVTPDSLDGAPGEEADYRIEIINKDTGTCTPKTLSLSAVFPNNEWQAFFGKDSPFELAQGAKQITNVRIKSPTNATAGTKKITLNIKNPNNTIIATKDITYVLPGVTPTQCVQANPEFSITPQTQNGNPGVGITYNMTVKNIDSSNCENRSFSFQATPPSSEWSANFAENSSSFASGESKEISVTITSPSNAPSGEHITVLKILENNIDLGSIVAVYNVLEDQITPIPGNTYLNFKIGIDGIGTTPRIPIGGNKNPNNIWRGLNFKIYNTTTNTLSFTGTNITFTYNQNSEKFELLYDLPSVENLPNGSYNIYVDGPGYLTNQYPGSFSITQGQVTDLTSNNFYLITGNVNNSDLSENRIDLMDYNLLLSCSVYSQDRSACDAGDNNERYTDLNDDGIVNEDDYTLFLKEFANQQGVILPE